MNAFNRAMTSVFDVLLTPFEILGPYGPLIFVSGIFGVFALLVFKHISWQKGIKATKDKIKGHLIEIRIFQDDLVVVTKAIGKVLGRNLQYLGLNFGPFVPLAIPFVVLASQFVVRYAFDPIPVQVQAAGLLPGQGTLISVEMAPGHEREVADLDLVLPDGLRAVSPMLRSPAEGVAYQEVVATAPGEHQIQLVLRGAGASRSEVKRLVAGDQPVRVMQPEKVRAGDVFASMLWPGEPGFDSDSPFQRVAISYPDREIEWLPDGVLGVLLSLLIFSMVAGITVLKPLGVQI